MRLKLFTLTALCHNRPLHGCRHCKVMRVLRRVGPRRPPKDRPRALERHMRAAGKAPCAQLLSLGSGRSDAPEAPNSEGGGDASRTWPRLPSDGDHRHLSLQSWPGLATSDKWAMPEGERRVSCPDCSCSAGGRGMGGQRSKSVGRFGTSPEHGRPRLGKLAGGELQVLLCKRPEIRAGWESSCWIGLACSRLGQRRQQLDRPIF